MPFFVASVCGLENSTLPLTSGRAFPPLRQSGQWEESVTVATFQIEILKCDLGSPESMDPVLVLIYLFSHWNVRLHRIAELQVVHSAHIDCLKYGTGPPPCSQDETYDQHTQVGFSFSSNDFQSLNPINQVPCALHVGEASLQKNSACPLGNFFQIICYSYTSMIKTVSGSTPMVFY